MPLVDVNQVTESLNTLQFTKPTNLPEKQIQQFENYIRQQKQSNMSTATGVLSLQDNQNAAALSAEEGISKLLERTKYAFAQEHGQRRYGPPPSWCADVIPPRGCEVFIGKIPRDCFEDELIPVFERIGPIYMFRLMMEFGGTNRGYGFCVYTNKDDTKKAVEQLDNYEIRKGKSIGVCYSVDNCRLFVGGIPKSKTREEILTEMKRVTEGVRDVISYPSVTDKNRNRGFAFVEYESHKAAAMARRKLIPGRIQLWGQQIAVDWAEPEREVNEDIMSKVKILYVRNLMLSTTEENLRQHIIHAAGGDTTCVERVKKISDYAFVHFKEREQAAVCLKALNDTFIEGSKVEVTWAKPVDKGDTNSRQSNARSSNKMIMSDLSLMKDFNSSNAPIFFDTQNSLFASFAAPGADALVQPGMDVSSHLLMPPVGHHTPLAPDLLSINPSSVTVPGASLGIGSSCLRFNGTRAGRRNAAGSRSVVIQRDRKHPVELFEELCRNYGWGTPVYSAIPVEVVDHISGRKWPLYIGQVILPNIQQSFQTTRYFTNQEDAKIGAFDVATQSIPQFHALTEALLGNYALPLSSSMMLSGPTYLPMQLSPISAVSSAALNLAQQSQHNTIQLSATVGVPSQTVSPTAINSTTTLPDCATGMAVNGLDYASHLISSQLGNQNLLNTFGNAPTYYVDSNGIPNPSAAAMLVGSGGSLSGLSSMIGLPNAPSTTVCSSTGLVAAETAAQFGQANQLPASQIQQVGLYNLNFSAPDIHPSSIMKPFCNMTQAAQQTPFVSVLTQQPNTITPSTSASVMGSSNGTYNKTQVNNSVSTTV